MLTPELIAYSIHDTEALTARLFTRVWRSYHDYSDIATTDSEYYRQTQRRVTEIYSPASIGKSHLDVMGVGVPPLSVVSRSNSGGE